MERCLKNENATYDMQSKKLAWFEDYLFNRMQLVCFDHLTSQTMKMTHGAPQGSILGYLLFTLLIREVHFVLEKCKILLYADHTVLLFSDT